MRTIGCLQFLLALFLLLLITTPVWPQVQVTPQAQPEYRIIKRKDDLLVCPNQVLKLNLDQEVKLNTYQVEELISLNSQSLHVLDTEVIKPSHRWVEYKGTAEKFCGNLWRHQDLFYRKASNTERIEMIESRQFQIMQSLARLQMTTYTRE